ncbi:serine protease [Planctomicrobium piriforme]|uniref:Serine protease n=1 Tax=Planctomicrobium piriforme TaxID=1576369 RepID=A0A1I3K9L4_9PLAN|nr:serine protease [Planctomicrobium piriforme]SFI69074.1 hypothetical protein SAMN05421753_111158 [Planctomicrobium piriforme]
MSSRRIATGLLAVLALLVVVSAIQAQGVCLPAPRLLTTLPMGGQAGTTFDVSITGESLDENGELLFSDARITAVPQRTPEGVAIPNKFAVTIAPDVPVGVYEARVMTRLGISSSRAFSVGALPEVTRAKSNTTLESALPLELNSVCNAATANKAVDFYTFHGTQGMRVVVECSAVGIDSKLTPVLIIADAQGRDLTVDRRGGFLDFTIPADSQYVIKVHGLTFQGGAEFFYRLAVQNIPVGEPAPRQPTTLAVNSFSRPSESTGNSSAAETEPNNRPAQAQQITLPCDVSGTFFPAGDVDTFEFAAKKGDVWWIEVVSERMGRPTNPFVLVQRVVKNADGEQLTDVAELNDIASPVKLSTNGYSYDGSPYDAGSADALGKVEIKEDGTYRLQLRDLFGGTRSDPRSVYRLIARQACPDFSIAAWALHMTLRNGDRNALSKPIALRNGGTMIFDVVALRKDGFDGEIEIGMEGLPAGVTACGFTIPAGKNSGTLLITAAEDAARSHGVAKIVGRAKINGETKTQIGRLASMAWPVRDSNQEIPNPRLLADVPVSVSGQEAAPLTIAPEENKTWLALPNDRLTIPLKLTWRGEFSGALKLKAIGNGFEKAAEIDVPLNAATVEAVLDLAALKTPPGEYTVAFYGGVVSKYRYNPDAVKAAEAAVQKADQDVAAAVTSVKLVTEAAQSASLEGKAAADAAVKQAQQQQKQAEAAKADAAKRLKAATDAAEPKDYAEIVVSEPIRILVKPADNK